MEQAWPSPQTTLSRRPPGTKPPHKGSDGNQNKRPPSPGVRDEAGRPPPGVTGRGDDVGPPGLAGDAASVCQQCGSIFHRSLTHTPRITPSVRPERRRSDDVKAAPIKAVTVKPYRTSKSGAVRRLANICSNETTEVNVSVSSLVGSRLEIRFGIESYSIARRHRVSSTKRISAAVILIQRSSEPEKIARAVTRTAALNYTGLVEEPADGLSPGRELIEGREPPLLNVSRGAEAGRALSANGAWSCGPSPLPMALDL
ncbi:unnamed protein product [Arctogadus glacialis]